MFGFDHGGAIRLVDAGWIRGEDVPFERKRARATAAAQLAIFAPSAFAAEAPLAEPSEQRGGSPNLPECLRAQIAGDLGQIRARRELPVGGDPTGLRPARTVRCRIGY